MNRTTVTFDGHDLTAECIVSDLRRPLLPRNLGSVDVPGMDGELPTGERLEAFDLGLTLSVMGRDPECREAARRRIADILNASGPRPLSISEDGGLFYMARANAPGDGDRHVNAERFDVEFRISDPVRYGLLRTVTVPKGGSVTFNVGGTYPTAPNVSAPFVFTASGQQWRLALDDGTYLLATHDSDAAVGGTVTFDCAERVARQGRNVFMLPALADWLVFSPGTHTLTMSGDAPNGDATVTFYERWV